MSNLSEKEELLILWFNNINGLGNKTKNKLIEYFGNIENIYNVSDNVLNSFLESINNRLQITKDLEKIKMLREKLYEKNIYFVYPGHKKYPAKLMNIYDKPRILYVKGKIKEEINIYNKNVGIVGSRLPDIYGEEMSRVFARDLAKNGINIVSGLAKGIDSKAHEGCLEAGGYTVAVIGCGINVVYPRENIELYREIEKKGAIISEYCLDVQPNSGFFPQRNRIISGMSDSIFVVEARQKSGSLITVDYGLEQGKQIYALPGRVLDKNSVGTNNLIKMGAVCVTEPNDIIMDMNGQCFFDNNDMCKEKSDINNIKEKNSLAPIEKMVYSCLSLEPMYIDEIIHKLNIDITKTISTLYILEEKKLIKQPIKGYYILAL